MKGKRKTVTFREEVYRAIQHYRGNYMFEKGKDMNFTDAVNELLKEILMERNIMQG